MVYSIAIVQDSTPKKTDVGSIYILREIIERATAATAQPGG